MNLLIPSLLSISLAGCASYSGTIDPEGVVTFDIVTTREVSNFYASKNSEGFEIAIGNASGIEGMADIVADKIIGKIPDTIGVELR